MDSSLAMREKLINLDQCEIEEKFGSDYPIVGLVLIENSQKKSRLFFYKTHNNIPYLNPFLACDKTLSDLAKDYKLLRSVQYGKLKKFRKALADGADIHTVDKRFLSVKYSIQSIDGTVCTWTDINNGMFDRLCNNKPSIIPAPYINDTYNLSIAHFASYYNKFSILRELITKHQGILSREDKNNFEKALVEYQHAQLQLQQAQQFSQIPYFQIDLSTEADNNDNNHNFYSEDDENVMLKVHINREMVKLNAVTPPSTWKYPYLDLDALATVYGYVICLNDKEGKKLVASFRDWQKHDLFTELVLQYVNEAIEDQSHDEEHLLTENLVELAQQLVMQDKKNKFSEKFLAQLLFFCATKTEETDNKEEYQESYNKLMHILLKRNHNKLLLKKLCNEPYNKAIFPFVVSKVKSYMQNNLLRNYVTKQLSSSGSCLYKDVAGIIAMYWQPDNEFKSYFKKDDHISSSIVSEGIPEIRSLDRSKKRRNVSE